MAFIKSLTISGLSLDSVVEADAKAFRDDLTELLLPLLSDERGRPDFLT